MKRNGLSASFIQIGNMYYLKKKNLVVVKSKDNLYKTNVYCINQQFRTTNDVAG